MNQCIEMDIAQNECIGYDGACEIPTGETAREDDQDENRDDMQKNGRPRKKAKIEAVEKPVTRGHRTRTNPRRTKSKKRRR